MVEVKYEYMCPICAYVNVFGRTYTHYSCPSCKVVVQAFDYVEQGTESKTEMPPTKKEEVH
jgi:phage FluMu protein Com